MRIKTIVALAMVVATFGFLMWSFSAVPDAAIYFGEPPMPDVRMTGYDAAEVQELMLQIGEAGRATYLIAQKKIDFIIPTLNAGMLLMVIWALADGLRTSTRRWSSGRALALATVGLIGPIFDYVENVLVADVMRAGPAAFDAGTVELASLCTVLKYSFSALSLLIILVLAAMRWHQRATVPHPAVDSRATS